MLRIDFSIYFIYLIESLAEEFRQAIQRELSFLEAVMEIFPSLDPASRSKGKIKNSTISGSLRQGTLVSSVFKLNGKYKRSINKDVDIDIELIANYEIKEPRKYIQEIKEKPGLVRMLKSCFSLIHPQYLEKYLRNLEPSCSKY